jgi:hypothetical protein
LFQHGAWQPPALKGLEDVAAECSERLLEGSRTPASVHVDTSEAILDVTDESEGADAITAERRSRHERKERREAGVASRVADASREKSKDGEAARGRAPTAIAAHAVR